MYSGNNIEKIIQNPIQNPISIFLNKKYQNIFLILYLLHYILNFVGSPLLKFTGIFIMLLSYLSVFILDYSVVVVLIIAYSFIEGQLRVVWGYGNFFRVSFDLLAILLYIKYAINEKKILSLNKVPVPFVFGFLLFVLYYILSMFNPYGAGVIGGLVVAKMYILPFLFLFLFIDISFSAEAINLFRKLLFPVALLFSILTLFHKVQGEQFLYGISTNYKNLFPVYEVFTGVLYRPWSTTMGPGAASSIFLLNFLIFYIPFFSKPTMSYSLLKFILTIFAILGAVVCNVRTALLQLIFYCFIILIATAYKGVQRFRRFMFFIFMILVFGVGVILSGTNVEGLSSQYKLDESIKRIEELKGSSKGEKKEFRSGPDVIFRDLQESVKWPFGYGPGMTTSVIPIFGDIRRNFPTFNFWTHDNFYYQMFQEFGVGAIFIISLYFYIPLIIFSKIIHDLKKNNFENFKIRFFALSFTLLSLGAAWASTALPYNPVSFFFIFWAALGLKNDPSQSFE